MPRNSKKAHVEYLGYIYSNKKETGVKSYIKVISDMSEYVEGMPLLVVGIANAKARPEKFNILDKHLSKNVFWTFSKFENKSEHDEDIKRFNKDVIRLTSENVRYYYVNIFRVSYTQVKKIYSMLFSSSRRYIYISNGMLYFPQGNNVFGISLKIMEYCGMDHSSRVERLKNDRGCTVLDEDSKFSFMLNGEVGNNRHLVAYIMSKCLT